ncbi:substrate-binding domain-containing protein [Volucribacter psittacicida]|nr:substrate-binding domain-containing protein [Volucribacter psittacicida]
MQQADFLQQKANALSSGEPSQLRILVEETLMTDNLMTLLAQFAQRFPLINVQIASEDNRQIAERITQGQADMGICYQQQLHPHLPSQVLGNERLIAVVAKYHPLATQHHISAQTLGQYCQLWHDDQQDYRLSPRQWQCNSYYSLCFLAQQGIGWCLLPAQLLNDEWLDDLVLLDLAFDLSTPQYPITLLFSHQHRPTPATAFLAEGLKTVFGG